MAKSQAHGRSVAANLRFAWKFLPTRPLQCGYPKQNWNRSPKAARRSRQARAFPTRSNWKTPSPRSSAPAVMCLSQTIRSSRQRQAALSLRWPGSVWLCNGRDFLTGRNFLEGAHMFCNSALPGSCPGYPHDRAVRITLVLGLALCVLFPPSRNSALAADEATGQPSTVLAAVDHRHSVSLDGAWHVIVDPYGNGLYNWNGKPRSSGFARNLAQTDSTGPIEYNFAKSPTLQVPGDWNTQRESLMFYEGPLWYEKDFEYHKTPAKRVFLHVGAANYRSYLWINGHAICEHEGGFTGFDCEITQALREGNNFAVIAVDSTRLADGVPTLKTDWWNYGGLTREVSLVEVPDRYIDEFDLHLKRGTRNEIEGWVHVVGAPTGSEIKVTLEKEGRSAGITAKTGEDGRAQIHLVDANLQLWAPEHPVLYRVLLMAGEDRLEDEMGFRTIEARETQILLNGQPIFLKGISVHAEAPYRTGRAFSEQDAETLLGWVHEIGRA